LCCLLSTALGILLQADAATPGVLDLADPANRDRWLSHPVIGEPSFDTFERDPGNPLWTGQPPYEWPVNGFLFRDPRSGRIYCYVSLYPRGYWPAGPAKAFRSVDDGRTWEDLGLVLTGDKDSFDGDGAEAGATLDPTVVADDDGYHMIYGWATPDNSDGGLAYAHSPTPEGPFVRDPQPIHAESRQPILAPGYKRVYAGTLVKRAHDWLVVADMSTPGNGGGMWAFICMTAPEACGPYSPPKMLRQPQDGRWQPQPTEFFPAFVHEGYVYAPFTSVAANRGYQVLLRAPVEHAHEPEAWETYEAGSLFHWEGPPSEAHGIWGQSFTGFVDPDGAYRVMFTSRNSEDRGTVNFARRPWKRPLTHGFRVSAPDAPSLALALVDATDFGLDVDIATTAPWALVWNVTGALGPDRPTAGAAMSPLTLRGATMLRLDGATQQRVRLRQRGASYRVSVDGTEVDSGTVRQAGGGVGILAEAGCSARVDRMVLSGRVASRFWTLTALEGLIGTGDVGTRWKPPSEGFRLGEGYEGDFDGARAKWNFEGRGVRIWSPRGPDFGAARVLLDGTLMAEVSLRADEPRPSSVVWQSGDLPPGPHALSLVRVSGALPLDCVEFVR